MSRRSGASASRGPDFTLKTNPLKRSDLDEFVACYNPANRHARTATWSEATAQGRWRSYSYGDLVQRDKCSLDIFWLRDESLADNLPPPDVIAAEIVEDLRAALEQFAEDSGGPDAPDTIGPRSSTQWVMGERPGFSRAWAYWRGRPAAVALRSFPLRRVARSGGTAWPADAEPGRQLT